jgi:hypothetical protein
VDRSIQYTGSGQNVLAADPLKRISQGKSNFCTDMPFLKYGTPISVLDPIQNDFLFPDSVYCYFFRNSNTNQDLDPVFSQKGGHTPHLTFICP